MASTHSNVLNIFHSPWCKFLFAWASTVKIRTRWFIRYDPLPFRGCSDEPPRSSRPVGSRLDHSPAGL